MIGDTDPEDAYDAGDPIGVRLYVIGRAVVAARADPVRGPARRAELARLLRDIAREVEHG